MSELKRYRLRGLARTDLTDKQMTVKIDKTAPDEHTARRMALEQAYAQGILIRNLEVEKVDAA